MSNGNGYFKLTLDDFGFVMDIMCYTKEVIKLTKKKNNNNSIG